MRPARLKTAMRVASTSTIAITMSTRLRRLTYCHSPQFRPRRSTTDPTHSLASGERADDRQSKRNDVRPALIVREDHLDEEDPDREADDRSHDGSKHHHRPS